ncbi:Uncharacterised protein [Vibrio cincinnatiensis]|jgi:hypothetical protein|nr:Uncharacterised protein [Vibrio cincinnatiensis]
MMLVNYTYLTLFSELGLPLINCWSVKVGTVIF